MMNFHPLPKPMTTLARLFAAGWTLHFPVTKQRDCLYLYHRDSRLIVIEADSDARLCVRRAGYLKHTVLS